MRNRIALLGLLLGGACGKVDDLPADASAPADSHYSDVTQGSIFDGGSIFDAAWPDRGLIDVYDPEPDGGPIPSPPCADAAVPCSIPPSECIDDHWLRSYTNGRCTDAGTCAFDVYEMKCPPSSTPPDCYQGGCRVVIVR
jgi:hypothetical protein